MKDQYIELAPAKVNLSLGIIEKQVDNFHRLEMVNHSVNLTDKLILTPSDSFQLKANNKSLETTDNLVFKAVRLLSQIFNLRPNFTLTLEKNIPMKAGLAGGSADAAATLRLLNRYWNLNLDQRSLTQLAIKLGADVPYCLVNNTAFVGGIGERIVPIKDFESDAILILVPNIQIETPKAFSLTDKEEKLYIPDSSQVIDIIETGNYNELKDVAGNSFTEPMSNLYPEIKELIQKLYDEGAYYATMSGSGSSIVGYFRTIEDRDRAANNFPDIRTIKTESYKTTKS